jgi:Rad3-related DNA helicase
LIPRRANSGTIITRTPASCAVPEGLPAPCDFGLPDRYVSWRRGQWQGVEDVIDSPQRFIVICAPTGFGKTPMAVAAAHLSNRRTVILTATRGLQDQYSQTLGEMLHDIRGQGNYTCPIAGQLGLAESTTVNEAPCQCGYNCLLRRRGCEYHDRYHDAQSARIVVTNYACWMFDALKDRDAIHIDPMLYAVAQETGSDEKDTRVPVDMLVCDEAGDTGSELERHIGLQVSRRECLQLRLPWPDAGLQLDQWREWSQRQEAAVKQRLAEWTERLRNGGSNGNGSRLWSREFKLLREMQRKLARLGEIRADDDWIMDEQQDRDTGEGLYAVRFAPLNPARYAEQALWRGVKKIVLMSATVRPKTAELLGIPPEQMKFIEYPSSFDKRRRPIIVVPSVMLNYKTEQSDTIMRQWLDRIDSIIASRLDRKGIILPVSYKRGRFIADNSAYGEHMILHNPHDRMQKIEAFRQADAPSILVSPSVGVGYDFPHCVAPDTRILCADLKWRAIGNVKVGDIVAGFDEHREQGRRERRWRESVVLRSKIVCLPCYRLVLDDGTEIVCSEDHQWLCQVADGGLKWHATKNLRAGLGSKWVSTICRLAPVWQPASDRESGYLAGAFDGEGSLHQTIERKGKTLTSEGKGKLGTVSLCFAQTENPMLYEVQSILARKGFQFDLYHKGRSDSSPQYKDGFTLRLRNRFEVLRFLGEMRPLRLLPKFSLNKMGAVRNIVPQRVLVKEFVGNQDVVAMTTSSHTYIAEGLGSHNCECRWLIIAKLPFASVNDPVIKARQMRDPEYQNFLVALELVQNCGRLMRAESDWGEVMLVDAAFDNWFFRRARKFFMQWWLDALVWADGVPPPMEEPRG